MAARSKKLLKVIDGIRSWNITFVEIDENLKGENFQIAIHGFPHQPTCMAFDPIQKIVAIGTKTGIIRIFGRPGVDYVVSHPSSSAVIEVIFLINEGGLISICQDDVVHLWNIKQKNPELVHSLQFKLCCWAIFIVATVTISKLARNRQVNAESTIELNIPKLSNPDLLYARAPLFKTPTHVTWCLSTD
ncbi:unnamed protein product [Echinostoma caproni]|uniref:WD_REPEATS_REGION domain-containing protein n=1 Tax=Echinostoma caproni TaxID=27848 RepID=A0A183ATM1_9TREM|nr:unnamed protein product [Echinostoma caproni]